MAHAMEAPAATHPWYRALDRRQWNTLIAANLGWLFDGYETYALILTVIPALRELLEPAQHTHIAVYAGTVIAFTLLGWGVGGLIGGVLADYIGRKRMMIYAIIAYSLTTGLSAIAQDWYTFAALRFIVGVAIGSEWATGSSLMAEVWPNGARGKGAGLMQCGLGIGFFIASLVWLFVSTTGAGAWRYMYLIGILPAFLTLWIRRGMPESALWQRADERRQAARSSAAGAGQARFTLVDLFSDPAARRNTFVALLMSFTTTLAWWGISSWVPPYIAAQAAAAM